jgi:hypothetical protein
VTSVKSEAKDVLALPVVRNFAWKSGVDLCPLVHSRECPSQSRSFVPQLF